MIEHQTITVIYLLTEVIGPNIVINLLTAIIHVYVELREKERAREREQHTRRPFDFFFFSQETRSQSAHWLS